MATATRHRMLSLPLGRPAALGVVVPQQHQQQCIFRMSSTTPEAGGEAEVMGEFTELSRLDIRVGKIVDVSTHPALEKIFVEKIDVGEDEPRTICSGLQGYLTAGDLQDKLCLVLCNLKPRDLDGVPSNGMVLCASNEEHSEVVLVNPPEGAVPGEVVTFEGHTSEPMAAGNRAVKAFKKVGDDFITDDDGVAMYIGEPTAPFMTTAGPCTATIKGGEIS